MIIPRRRQRDTFLPLTQLLVDMLTIYALLWFVFWIRFSSQIFPSDLGVGDYPIYFRSFFFIVLATIFFLRHFGLYRPAKLMTFSDESIRVVKSVLWSTIVLTALTFFIRGFTYSRSYLVIVGVALTAGIS